MSNGTTLVYNRQARLIEGPSVEGPKPKGKKHLKGPMKVCRFSPGNNKVPNWYLEGMLAHKHGAKLFDDSGIVVPPLKVLGKGTSVDRFERKPQAPPNPFASSGGTITSPTSLEGLEASDVAKAIALEEDGDRLMAWGNESKQHIDAITERLLAINYQLGG